MAVALPGVYKKCNHTHIKASLSYLNHKPNILDMSKIVEVIVLLAVCLAAGEAFKVRPPMRPQLHIEVPMDPSEVGASEKGISEEVELTESDLEKAGVPQPLAIAATRGGGGRGICTIICRFGHCRGVCRIFV